jgi:hypothetical protein
VRYSVRRRRVLQCAARVLNASKHGKGGSTNISKVPSTSVRTSNTASMEAAMLLTRQPYAHVTTLSLLLANSNCSTSPVRRRYK